MKRWLVSLIALTAAAATACSMSHRTSARSPEPLEQTAPAESTAGALIVLDATSDEAPALAARGEQVDADVASCLMGLESAAVRVIEIDGTRALQFTAPPAEAGVLRDRVELLAEAYAGPYRHEQPPYRVRYEPMLNGARIVFDPVHPEDLAPLSREVEEHAADVL